MHYRESLPSFGLSHLVLSFWEFTVSGTVPGPRYHHVFPDGCALLSYCGKSMRLAPGLRVIGPTIRSRVVPVWPGEIWWGVRLQPAAVQAVTGCPAGKLRDRAEACAVINPELDRALLYPLEDSKCFADAVIAYEQVLGMLIRQQIDSKVAAAAHFIDNTGGRAKIEEVALAVGLSERQLQRRFNQAVGLTPKQFARVRRLRSTTVAMLGTELTDWAGLAAEAGYADQSHLTHEFNALTGHLPTSFEQRVRRIEHGFLRH
jgi:AraC-like DNA-binding protein